MTKMADKKLTNSARNNNLCLLTLVEYPGGIAVCRVIGADGSFDHAVAVTENWVFDSRFDFAVPLTKDNLDTICEAKYMKRGFGYYFRLHDKFK